MKVHPPLLPVDADLEFFQTEHFHWAQMLEDHFEVIRAELDALENEDFNDWPNEQQYRNNWKLFLFFVPGSSIEKHCQACPETVRLLRQIPGIQMATFSKLPAGSQIVPHTGFSRVVLRSHLALKVPEGANEQNCALRIGKSTRTWQEGKVHIFDDIHQHEAFNHLDSDRIVLMMDFMRPWRYRTSSVGYFRQRLFPHPHYKLAYKDYIAEAREQGQKI